MHYHYATPASDCGYSRCSLYKIKSKLVSVAGSDSLLQMAAFTQPGVVQLDETATKESLATPWNVVVHNDPINLMTYVTMVFQRVFGYPREKAKRHMLEVHQRGRSIVWSGGREQAEHYVHQLQSYQLLTTMEKSEP